MLSCYRLSDRIFESQQFQNLTVDCGGLLYVSTLYQPLQHICQTFSGLCDSCCQLMCQIAIGRHLCDIFLRHRKFHFVKIHEIQNLRIRERITFMPDLLQRILINRKPHIHQLFCHGYRILVHRQRCHIQRFQYGSFCCHIGKKRTQIQCLPVIFYLKGNVLPQFQTDIRIHFCIHQDILQQTDLRIIALPGDHLSSEGLPGNQCTDLPVYLFGIRIIWSLYSAVIRYFIL